MWKNSILALGLMSVVALSPLACSSSSSGGGGGGGPTPNVNVAVGTLAGPDTAIVAIFLNVFGLDPSSATPTPDIILDAPGSAIAQPTSLVLTENDLVVCNGNFDPFGSGNNTVQIFRNYTELADGDAADIILTAGISDPVQCLVDEVNDILFIANAGAGEVRLVTDFSNIAAGTDPVTTQVVLNGAGSLLAFPSSIALSEDDLYVANANNTGPSAPCVTIYRDVTTLAGADAPDVTLEADSSFLDDGFGLPERCIQLTVGGSSTAKTLFVTTTASEIFVFQNAGELETNALPDAVLTGDASNLYIAVQPLVVGDRLYVANHDLLGLAFGPPECADAPGVVGFSSVSTMISGQTPAALLPVRSAHGLAVAGDTLFAAGTDNCLHPFTLGSTGSVSIFRNATTLSSFQAPDLVIPGTQGDGSVISFPISVAAREATVTF